MADIEDKQDSDYESSKEKFLDLEEKLDNLNESLANQERHYEEDIRDLRRQLEISSTKQRELQLKIDKFEEVREKSEQDKEKREEVDGVSELAAGIEVLRDKVDQQTGEDFQEQNSFFWRIYKHGHDR